MPDMAPHPVRRSSRYLPAAAAAAGVAAAIAPGLLLADVDLGIRSGDSVKGTFSPGDEEESFAIDVPTGARLTVKSKAAKRGAPPRLTLRGPDDGVVVVGLEKGTKSTLAGFVVATGGPHRVVMTSRDGVTVGDYQFTCAWKPQRTFTGILALPGGAEERTLRFGADAGAAVTFDVKAAKGSGALPRIVRVVGADAYSLDLGSAEAHAASDREGPVVLPRGGEYEVVVDGAGAAGDVVVRISVRPPKGSKRKIDVSSRALGAASGPASGVAVGKVIGGEGGSVAVPDLGLGGGPGDISGSAVTIPKGALPAGTAIFVGTAPGIDPKDGASPLGPAVTFGPDGTKFGTKAAPADAKITIPIDLSLVGGDTTQVTVYTRNAKGKVSPVPGPYDFSVDGFVSFPTSHFSAYQASAVLPGDPTSSLQTLVGGLGGGAPADVATAFGSSGQLYYVAHGSVLYAVGFNTSPPPFGLVATPFAGTGATTPAGTTAIARANFKFGGGLQSVVSTGSAVYVGDGPQVWKIDLFDDTVARHFGTGTAGDSGDNGAATAAEIRAADDLFVNSQGILLVVDTQSGRIRGVDATGTAFTLAGTGTNAVSADGAAIAGRDLNEPASIVEHPSAQGVYLVAERDRVRVLDTNNDTLATLAGATDGARGCAVGPPSETRFTRLTSVTVDVLSETVFVGDESCHTIVEIPLDGSETSFVAGDPNIPGFTPDAATIAGKIRIDRPRGLLAAAGLLVFLDAGNGALRSIVPELQ